MENALKTLFTGKCLSEAEAEQAMTLVLSGQAHLEQIGALLTVLHFRAPAASELAGFVKALRAASPTMSTSIPSEDLLDVCGTGGDGGGSFNVSTCVAFIVAAAGQKVAKHGNRAVSSRCGSFDVLETLGISFATNFEEAEQALHSYGLSFLFAPSFYPVLKKLAPVRKNLGVRTVFNALGPLLNPLKAGRQLMGVYSEALLVPVAEALQTLGSTEVMVVRGQDGVDEVSLAESTDSVHLKNGKFQKKTIHPSQLGLRTRPASAIAGGDPTENARILISVLDGDEGASRDIALLNSAAALVVSGKAQDLKEGFERAKEAIDSGKARILLEAMRGSSLSELQIVKPQRQAL